MDKPSIYYQFDYEEYRKSHYGEGYFSYEKDGFGPVCYNELAVIKNIKLFAEKDFMIDEKMRKKIEKFFSIRDKNNCKRIYEEIIKLIDNNH
ncbi:MAG: CDP-glycerol glycerophosphotransferase family protein [Bacilli bacterium]|nr:CDP-glycerol glycerophosphotransferase family protein [Bacilli bacterium]